MSLAHNEWDVAVQTKGQANECDQDGHSFLGSTGYDYLPHASQAFEESCKAARIGPKFMSLRAGTRVLRHTCHGFCQQICFEPICHNATVLTRFIEHLRWLFAAALIAALRAPRLPPVGYFTGWSRSGFGRAFVCM